MATKSIFVDSYGDVHRGIAIDPTSLNGLVDFLHNKIDLCSDALGQEDSNDCAKSGSGRSYKVGKYNEAKDCEFCNRYAALILAKYELKERA